MAALPSVSDPTLDAVAFEVKRRNAVEPRRQYLGMSDIARPCERERWYYFRWVIREEFDADTLYRFDDGHRTEGLLASRLRMVKGVDLKVLDPRTGQQFRFTDLGGHFSGHADGLIIGIKQAPGTMHVWEAKAANETKFGKIATLKMKHGEKATLLNWDPVYYGQACLYMAYADVTRHYMTIATPGGRMMTSIRTNTDLDTARALREKAERVIEAAEPPPKISESPSWYVCKMCSYSSVCHGATMPDVNCRTCIHATPEPDGDARWSCALADKVTIPPDVVLTGCDSHRYIPALVKIGKQVDASADENWIEYELPDKRRFRNGDAGPTSYPSAELKHLTPALVGDTITDQMRAEFGAKISGSE